MNGTKKHYYCFVYYNYSTYPVPTSPYIRAEKLVYEDHNTSTEVLWAYTAKQSAYNTQSRSIPYYNGPVGYNGTCPTMTMIRMFYTKNGLPIDQDNSWETYYNNQFGYASWTGNDTIAKVGNNVQYENWDRES
jgi:starch-binding outer membrane protein, SusD/RagB family